VSPAPIARHEEADGGRPAPQRLPLSVADCLQRLLLHVPVPQTRVVRSYGLDHHTQAEALAACRTHLGQPPMVAPAPVDWQTMCAQRGDAYRERWAAARWGSCRTGNAHSVPSYGGESAGHQSDSLRVTQRNLHSARLKKPGRAASVGGQSNTELKPSPGRPGWSARA
jgi:hypothetical protein